MSRLIIDIETAGREFDSLDRSFKGYFQLRAEAGEDMAKAMEMLSLHPLTAEIVTVGLLDPDTGKGMAYYQAPGELPLPFEEDGVSFEAGSEQEILRKFWETVRKYDTIVTFNGRAFDCPFIIVRSAVHRIKPARDLMPNRYSGPHIDLYDRLTFFGATQKKFGLDQWCAAMGIKGPKGEVSGKDVGGLYREGRYIEIARYCMRDVRATAELLKVWETYM